MRVRKQTSDGDMMFGASMGHIWQDEVDGVGQLILTRLLLYRGEWFLDRAEGTPWGGVPLNEFVVQQGQILGKNTDAIRDLAIKERVLLTPGVDHIAQYDSNVDPNTRRFHVHIVVNTIYGRLTLEGGNGEFVVNPLRSNPPPRQLQRQRLLSQVIQVR